MLVSQNFTHFIHCHQIHQTCSEYYLCHRNLDRTKPVASNNKEKQGLTQPVVSGDLRETYMNKTTKLQLSGTVGETGWKCSATFPSGGPGISGRSCQGRAFRFGLGRELMRAGHENRGALRQWKPRENATVLDKQASIDLYIVTTTYPKRHYQPSCTHAADDCT